ncbi:MAG: hypothetical protein ND895_19760 [Pyrinomonadaceae bacterium]|nr:hypothetical protein [Pyrinomonadaceae bacterium]
MPRSSSKKKKGAKASGGSQTSPPLDPLRRGMPAQDSILGVKEMKRGGQVYRVIRTTEIDEYEEPPAKGERKQRR